MAYQQSTNGLYPTPGVPSGVPRYDEHGNKHEASLPATHPANNASVPSPPQPYYHSQLPPQQASFYAPTASYQSYPQQTPGYHVLSPSPMHGPPAGHSYQDDLSHRMGATSLSTNPPVATQWSLGHDTADSTTELESQRGWTSTLATGAIGGFAVHKIHQKLSGHGQSNNSHQPSGAPPMATSYSPQWPLNLPAGSTITFDFLPNGVEKDKKMGKVYTYVLVEPGSGLSQPYYACTFVDDKRFGKHAGLRVYQNPNRNPAQARRICKFTYRSGGEKVEIVHPWVEWDDKWQPQEEVWLSDVGTLPGEELLWVYDWVDRPVRDKKAQSIIRCQYNEDETKEVCRITMY